MRRELMFGLMLLVSLEGLVSEGMPLEKLRYGVASTGPHYVLPLMAADEQGFWKQNGLEVQWFAFRGATALQKGIVAGSIDMGGTSLPDVIQASSRGVPMVSVANLNKLDYLVWVRTDSPIRGPEDLKGTKLGVQAMGGMSHAYARFLARKLGLEKEIKFVSTGGIQADIAAIIAGRIDGRVGTTTVMLPLVLAGRLRPVVSISEYFPREWVDNGVSAPKWLIDKNPELVRRTVRAVLQGLDFMLKNKPWAVERIQKELRYTSEQASAVFDILGFGPDRRISRKAVENVSDFLIEYGIVVKEKVPAVDELFTNRFVE